MAENIEPERPARHAGGLQIPRLRTASASPSAIERISKSVFSELCGATAAFVPVRRATRVDPIVALRSDS